MDDQDKALAWLVDESDKCPGCGTRSYEADDFVPARVVCRVCKRLEETVDEAKAHPSKGLHIMLRRVDGD